MHIPIVSPRRLALIAAFFATASLADAQCFTEDAFEPNDDCSNAVPLVPGTYTDLNSHGTAGPNGENPDFYEVVVPAGQVLRVYVRELVPQGPGWLSGYLYAANSPDCGTLQGVIDEDQGSGQGRHLEYHNQTGSAFTVIVQVSMAKPTGSDTSTSCERYDLVVEVTNPPCEAAADDPLEENDDCLSAVALAPGLTPDLRVTSDDPDYYLIQVPAGHRIDAEAEFSPYFGARVGMRLHSGPTCYIQLDEHDSLYAPLGLSDVTWVNHGVIDRSVVLEITTEDGSGPCADYDLSVIVVPDACQAVGDAFEPNSDCGSAAGLTAGIYRDLRVAGNQDDEDWFSLLVPPSSTVLVYIDSFPNVGPSGHLFTYLFDSTCSTSIGANDPWHNNPWHMWTNSSDQTEEVHLQVRLNANWVLACTRYDIYVEFAQLQLPTPFCYGDGSADAGSGPVSCPCGNNAPIGSGSGCLNGLGHGATLTHFGSSHVPADDLGFTLTGGPPGQPSLLVQGSSRMAMPFRDGVFCMGFQTTRIEPVMLDASGSGSTSSSILEADSYLRPEPGDTRYYQQWYRTPAALSACGTGSNFTQGLIVEWY